MLAILSIPKSCLFLSGLSLIRERELFGFCLIGDMLKIGFVSHSAYLD